MGDAETAITYTVDQFGHMIPMGSPDMLVPVRCRKCGEVYDLCAGEPIQRYADCTVYRTPCCGKVVDDREWVGNRAFDRLQKPDEYGSIPP